MTDICIEDMTEIVDIIANEAYDIEEYGSVSVIAFYEDMAGILKELLAYEDFMVGNIELYDFEMTNYDKEYIMTICEDLKIWIQPMFNGERYINYEAGKVFIADDCHSSVLEYNFNRKSDTYCFGYAEDEEICECEDCQCEDEDDTNDSMHSFSITSSDQYGISTYSFYSTDLGLVKEFAERFKK
jgi:hypothetical protein